MEIQSRVEVAGFEAAALDAAVFDELGGQLVEALLVLLHLAVALVAAEEVVDLALGELRFLFRGGGHLNFE